MNRFQAVQQSDFRGQLRLALPRQGLSESMQAVKTGGRNPRNFALSPDGEWLVCGHQDTPLLTVFRVDGAAGRLARTGNTANVPSCVCVLFYD